MKNISLCLILRQVPTDPIYLTVYTSLAISSCLSVTFTVLLAIRFSQSTTFHRNIKVLIYLLFIYGIIFNLMTDITYIFHIYHIINENSPCSLVFYTKECSWSLIPLTTCIIGFILIQAALTIERVIATYRLGHYEREGKYVGPILAVMVLLLSIHCMRWGLAATDDAEVQTQCVAIPNSATPRISVIYLIMLIVDLISMLVFAYCLHHNKRKLSSGKYSLDLRYEIQGNLRVLRILFPIVISHLLVFGLFIIGNIVIRDFREKFHTKTFSISLAAVYIPPYYFLIVSSWIYLVLKRESRALREFQNAIAQRPGPKTETDAYFSSLQNQWS